MFSSKTITIFIKKFCISEFSALPYMMKLKNGSVVYERKDMGWRQENAKAECLSNLTVLYHETALL